MEWRRAQMMSCSPDAAAGTPSSSAGPSAPAPVSRKQQQKHARRAPAPDVPSVRSRVLAYSCTPYG